MHRLMAGNVQKSQNTLQLREKNRYTNGWGGGWGGRRPGRRQTGAKTHRQQGSNRKARMTVCRVTAGARPVQVLGDGVSTVAAWTTN